MLNKKTWMGAFVILVLGVMLTGCATAPSGINQSVEAVAITVNPGANESVIVIQRTRTAVASAVSMRVWINGDELASGIRNGNEIQIIVPNGEHTIQAGSTSVDRGNSITFSVNEEAIFFFAEPRMGALSARFNLTTRGSRPLL